MVTKSSCSVPSFVMRAQEALERFLDQPPLLLHVAPQPCQRDARIVGDRSVRQNLAAQIVRQIAQIGDRARMRRQPRKFFARGQAESSAPPTPDRAAEPVRKFPAARASRLRCADRATAGAGSAISSKRTRIAAPREAGCGCDDVAQILDRFRRIGQRGFDRGAVRNRRDRGQFRAAQRAAHVAPQQRPQRFEFKNGFGVHRNSFFDHFERARRSGDIRRCSPRFTHSRG